MLSEGSIAYEEEKMDNNQQNNGIGPGNNRNNGNGGPGNGNRNHSTILIFMAVTLITLLIMNFFNKMVKDTTSQEITYDEFLEMVDKGLVEEVTLDEDTITVVPKVQPFSASGMEISYYTGRIYSDTELVSRLEKAGIRFNEEIPDTTTNLILNVVLSFAPLILIWILLGVVMRKMAGGGGMMGVG